MEPIDLVNTSQNSERLLVLGGCRSGKSTYAEEWARSRYQRRLFIATLDPGDDEEMLKRVELHRQVRGEGWHTIEEPVALSEVLDANSRHFDTAVVDCLTLWITNLMLKGYSDEAIFSEVRKLAAMTASWSLSVVFVANEVGLGIVPDNVMARRFRDLAGWTNQQIASACEQVVFMAAGLPMRLKG